MIEEIVDNYEKPYGIKHIYLRYFNAAGCDPEGRIGEDHYPETHIIPLLLKTALGLKKQFTILGNDYDTKDGTCIRDYIHVMDIADAHVKAINYLETQKQSDAFNLGTSVGYSVKEIIKKVEDITGKKIPVEYAERREGDPAILIASSKKAKETLEWFPRYNIDNMIETAWKWAQLNPKGYRNVR
jgi:UDP-glucose 4-epimerase